MDQRTTRIYENTTDKPINIVGLGVIPAHERLSVTTEYHTPVNLANYPGVIDVLAQEAAGTPTASPEQKPLAPAQPQEEQRNV